MRGQSSEPSRAGTVLLGGLARRPRGTPSAPRATLAERWEALSAPARRAETIALAIYTRLCASSTRPPEWDREQEELRHGLRVAAVAALRASKATGGRQAARVLPVAEALYASLCRAGGRPVAMAEESDKFRKEIRSAARAAIQAADGKAAVCVVCGELELFPAVAGGPHYCQAHRHLAPGWIEPPPPPPPRHPFADSPWWPAGIKANAMRNLGGHDNGPMKCEQAPESDAELLALLVKGQALVNQRRAEVAAVPEPPQYLEPAKDKPGPRHENPRYAEQMAEHAHHAFKLVMAEEYVLLIGMRLDPGKSRQQLGHELLGFPPPAEQPAPGEPLEDPAAASGR